LEASTVDLIEVARDEERPSGIRFGALVHGILATVPLDADADLVHQLTVSQGRALAASDEEVAAAAIAVERVLAHPILRRAQSASLEQRCRREVPVTLRVESGSLIEGLVDLAFKEDGRWTIVDFKTDEELRRAANYRQQVKLYKDAVQASTGEPADAVLMRV
jgi:ATP-dependent exoDNAse (exonuclease V) beta subunit